MPKKLFDNQMIGLLWNQRLPLAEVAGYAERS
jgi:hypothetical protein